jgi:hypothetical protein
MMHQLVSVAVLIVGIWTVGGLFIYGFLKL